jgi:GTP pyrophosphokinase
MSTAHDFSSNGNDKNDPQVLSSQTEKLVGDLVPTNGDTTRVPTNDKETGIVADSLPAMILKKDLGPRIAYLGPVPYFSVEQALSFVLSVYKADGQEITSDCLQHAVAVAQILAELQMDSDTIIAGILHQVVEHGQISLDVVEKEFGKAVARLIEGETKVSRLPEMTESPIADENIENLRQMFIAMASDFRIIVIKLADRLHAMRTLSSISPERQRRLARETLDIFAPLAHRLGIWSVKSELENLAFLYLYPDEYRKIRCLIEGRMPSYKRILEESKSRLEHALSSDPILRRTVSRIEVAARSKEIYSIWQKLQRGRAQRLDHIYDLVALRVTLDPREDLFVSQSYDNESGERDEQERARWREDENSLCYYVLGIVHQLWHPVPGRVKDYIAFPKPNGYQSLHTTVVVDSGIDQAPLEVQIRTREMDRTAEYGMAAHWYFKEQDQPTAAAANSWLSNIQEWNMDVQSSHEFVDLVRRELLGNRVFVFVNDSSSENATRILNLPRGSTVVDVAFAISTDAGYRMIAAKVNGSMVPMNYVLQNADMVQIVRSKYSPGPSLEWVQYAKTRLARHALRQFFAAWHSGTEPPKQSADGSESEREASAFEADELAGSVADYNQPWGALNEELGAQWDRSQRNDDAVNSLLSSMNPEQLVDDSCMKIPAGLLLFENGLKFASMTAGRCCLPLPGDGVFGLVATGSDEIEIHRQQCARGRRMAVQSPGLQKVAAQWQNVSRTGAEAAPRLPACLKVTCIDRNGLLSDVSRAIIERGITILSTRSASIENTAYLEYCVAVVHRMELESLYAALRDIPGVVNVEDAAGGYV